MKCSRCKARAEFRIPDTNKAVCKDHAAAFLLAKGAKTSFLPRIGNPRFQAKAKLITS
ncbi:MAG: hypothetical protein AABX14_02225 [Candidatus Aenigmatarchaeota archaeon]